MDGKKVYQIEINGIKESANAVDALNRKLNELDKTLKSLEKANVSVGTSGSKSNGLSAQIAQQKELNKLKKEEAAQERLVANEYSNTMKGMKQQLADLKTVMNATDLGDESFGKMSKQAGELTKKLKELEAAYGQFGRDVGNYDRIGQGLDKLKINVGGITREFGSAREASKTLKNELTALQVQGKGNTKQADELRSAFYNLKSAMDDATKSSQAMDTAMDFMQSFTAMASVGNGLQAFFGFDDNEITKSIQKLVALQGVLNGLETLRKQMETQEGIGAILGKSFKDVDKWTYGLQRTNVALRGTGTSARIAAAGIKVLNVALKGLMTLGIGVALDLIVEGIQKLVGAVKDWAKGDADLVDASEVMKNALDAQNKVLQQNLELIKQKKDSGQITSEQARAQIEKEYAKQLEEVNNGLLKRVKILQQLGLATKDINLSTVMGDKGVTWIGGFKDAIKSLEDFNKRWDDLEDRVAHGESLSSWFSSVDDAKDEFAHLNQLVGQDFLAAMTKFSDGTEEGTRALARYIDKMDELTSGRYSKAMNLVKFDNEGLQKDIENAWAMIQNLRDNVFKNPIVVTVELDAKINSELDRLDPTRAAQRTVDEWKALLKKGVDEAGTVLTEAQKANIKKIIAEQEKNIAKQRQQRLDSERNNARKLAQEQERVEKELAQLRIANMKEGLEKTLAQLKEERRERLEQAKITGIKVNELTAEINKLYRKKELEAIKEHNKEVKKVVDEMWSQIARTSNDAIRMNLDSELTRLDTTIEQMKQRLTSLNTVEGGIFNPRYASYGGAQLPNDMSDELRRGLGHDLQAKKQAPIDEGMIRMAKEYLDLLEDIEAVKITDMHFGDDADTFKEEYDKATKALNDWLEANRTTTDEMEEMWSVQELKQDGYTKSLTNAYKIRIREASLYYQKIGELEKKYSEDVKNNELAALKQDSGVTANEQVLRYETQLAQLEEYKEKGLLTEEKYNELRQRAEQANADALKAIQTKYEAESERLEQEHNERLKQSVAEGMRGMLNEYRDAYNNISKLQSRQPQKMGGVLGDMGIINFGLTKKNYKEALASYQELSRNILSEKEKLQSKLDAGQISFDDFQQAKRELDGLEQDCADAAQATQENLKKLGGEWWGSINTWVQQAGQVVNQVMQAIWSAQDAAYEEEQEKLKEQIKFQEDIYNKQKELAEEHKNNINDIENELSTARGDRRQHLIDQLNAEIEAQRRAVQEQKKAEKEKQKLEKKAEKEELEQKKREKKRAIVQALINTALSISMAAVNSWPMPAIAMMAAAAAMGAAQVAAISSQKYAKGGLLEGKSHREGGIPVGNTGIEVEGKEYIVRKSSTTPNIELLDYINKSQRKLSLDDFIDFYSSGKARSTFANSTRKFEDGGMLPTLRSDIDVPSRLISTMEDYANRPYVVQVVDIMDKTSQVKQVQAMAGIEG
jgi:hypothetical protein